MKITIARQDLLEAVNKVKSVVAGKSALPILSHILFETTDTGIRVLATDLKVSIECTVDCDVHRPGSMTMLCQRISMMISELPPNSDVTLDLGENNVITLTCGRIETKLFSMAPDEFPPMRSFDGIDPFNLKQNLLKGLLNKSSYAICTDQARYNLTGLLLELKQGRLVAVATDGRRMSLARQTEGVPEDIERRVIIPAKMIHELERLLEGDEEVQIRIDESQAEFCFNQTRLVTSLIEGNFPNYEMVIPQKHDKEVIINTASFMEAMRRTRTMTNDKFNSVRISVEDKQVRLKVVTPEIGEYEEDLATDYDGERVEIAFNPEFILEVLRHVETKNVCLLLKDGMSPGVLKPYSDSPEETYVNVIMPIRV